MNEIKDFQSAPVKEVNSSITMKNQYKHGFTGIKLPGSLANRGIFIIGQSGVMLNVLERRLLFKQHISRNIQRFR